MSKKLRLHAAESAVLGMLWLALALSACGGPQSGPVQKAEPPFEPATARGLPEPPTDPGHPAPPRTTAATEIQFDSNNVFDYTNNGETGDKGGGTFAVLPGGEDDLNSAWVVFQVQLAADDRPVSIDLGSTTATLPGGEDDLELSFWLGAYSFSQTCWDWLEPGPAEADPVRPGAWAAQGNLQIPLNSEELRQRYCNLGGEVYFCVLVEPKVRSGAWCGVTIQPSNLNLLDKSDPGYFRTQPLPSAINSATGDTGSGTITLDVPQGEAGEPDRTYIERRETGGTSSMKVTSAAGGGWQPIGYLPKGVVTYLDPTDNANPGQTRPAAGKTYEYRATAAVLINNRIFKARRSRPFQGQLRGWDTFTFGSSADNFDPCLVDVAGNPAVIWGNDPGSGGQLRYARATTTDGSTQSDWNSGLTLVADSSLVASEFDSSLRVVGGNPAVAYRDSRTGEIAYKRADTALGTTTWSAGAVVSRAGDSAFSPSLASVGATGNPAVAYYASNIDCLGFNHSNTPDGSAQNDWPAAKIISGGGILPSLAEVNLRPAVSFKGGAGNANLVYGLAQGDGMVGAWDFVDIDTSFQPGWASTLVLVNGTPAISHFSQSVNAINYDHANTDGVTFSDWVGNFVTLDLAGVELPTTEGVNLAVVAGKPVMAYKFNGTLRLARATTADGNQLADWQKESTSFVAVGNVSIAEVDGRLAMVWVDAAGELNYAIEQQ